MTQVLDLKKSTTIIDARGPRFGAVITSIVLATALMMHFAQMLYVV